MPETKPASFYRKLLRDAWQITRQRKRLWVFGMFAAAASTGGVMEVAGRSFRRIEHGRDLWMSLSEGSSAGLDLMGQYLRQLQFLEPNRIIGIVTILTLAGVALVVLISWSRAALMVGAAAEEEKTFGQLWRASAKHFWSVLLLNIITKAATGLLIVLTTLPLVLFITSAQYTDALIYFFSFLVFFPAIIIVQIMAMLALVEIIQNKRSIPEAIGRAVIMFGRHWLVTLELGLALFILVFAAGLAVLAVMVLLVIPYAIFLILALKTATLVIFIFVHIIGFSVLATLLLAYLGAATTFQHTAWLFFYQRALKKGGAKKVVAKLERLWAKV
ncbi:hypothetical protein KJ611_01100 [Patescibacteria group bacterium]|nr:hypothetical protein [Patescibacteria group bacterium]MBU1705282.1 hypothetical protein [Patescibacteria group bacterium]